MSDTKSSPAIPPESQLRLAVLTNADGNLLAKLHFIGQSDGQITVTASGTEPSAQDILKLVSDAARTVPHAGAVADRIAEIHRVVTADLRARGYEVKDLPPADFELRFALDLSTGLSLATQVPLHDLATPNEEIARAIQKQIATAFTSARDELALRVAEYVSTGGHKEAAELVSEARQGMAFMSAPTPQLLDAMERIDVGVLAPELSKTVRECRLAIAAMLERYDSAGRDAQSLLADAPQMKLPAQANLRNIVAVAAVKRGDIETALVIWRQLTRNPEELDAGLRGWVWRNLSMALDRHDAAARRAARLSADAFIEAGKKRDAATSLMHLSHLLEHEDAQQAIQQLDEMLKLMTESDLLGDELRAAIHHAKANRYFALRDYSAALPAALEAVRLRRGVSGAEAHLISSLHLAALQAKGLNDSAQATALEQEAKRLESSHPMPRFAIADRVAALFTSFDSRSAERLLAEAQSTEDPDLKAAISVAVATTDPALQPIERLQRLEGTVRDLESQGASAGAKQPVYVAIANVLRNEQEFNRAAQWLRKALDSNPLDLNIGELLLDTLWRDNDWGEAAIFLKKQIDRLGSKPGLLTAYGRSLLEAGDVNRAVTALTQALKIAKVEAKPQVNELRDRALDLGGVPIPTATPTQPTPIKSHDVEQSLRDFGKFVAADKRMRFWMKADAASDYTWISHPEQRAQDLLHTFFKARFQDEVSVFEELATGAGRLDIMLKFRGGLSAIVELKMCGFGYSSNYAASGEDQIKHYMENRNVHLGYLLVHDARLNDFSAPLITGSGNGQNTIVEIFVDLRPRVSARRSQS